MSEINDVMRKTKNDEGSVMEAENLEASCSRGVEMKGGSESLVWLYEMFNEEEEMDRQKKPSTMQDKKRKAEDNLSDTSIEEVGRNSKRASVDKDKREGKMGEGVSKDLSGERNGQIIKIVKEQMNELQKLVSSKKHKWADIKQLVDELKSNVFKTETEITRLNIEYEKVEKNATTKRQARKDTRRNGWQSRGNGRRQEGTGEANKRPGDKKLEARTAKKRYGCKRKQDGVQNEAV